MVADLILSTGADIPFPELGISIHQPRMHEIAFVGEETFFVGCEFLTFSKEKFLEDKDKNNLKDKSDFEVLMSIVKEKKLSLQKAKLSMQMVLSLIFPECAFSFQNDKIAFTKAGTDEHYQIDKSNFEIFKEIITDMFLLKKSNNEGLNYNPGNDAAKAIAEKFRKGRAKVAELKGESKKVAILSRYISILVIGLKKDYNSFLNYTVYQVFDEFERFELKESYDLYLRAKMMGAKDLDEVENWMKNLHP